MHRRAISILAALTMLAGALALPTTLTAAGASASAPPHRLAVVEGGSRTISILDPAAAEARASIFADYSPSLLGGSSVDAPSWSPDGRQLAYAWSASGVRVWETQVRIRDLDHGTDRTVVSLPAVAGWIQQVAWSPDGRRLAFVLFTPNWAVALATWSCLGSRWDLYVVDADGSNLRPLSPLHASADTDPVWSPDGSRLAFTSDREGVSSVFNVPVDGPPVPARVSPIAMVAGRPAWSPDGEHIAFHAAPATGALGPPDLWVARPDGANARKLADAVHQWDRAAPSWAPDSSQVAFSDGTGVFVVDAAGGAPAVRLTSGNDTAPSWSPGGDIAYMNELGGWRDDDRSCGLYLTRPGAAPRRISRACHLQAPYVWSPR